MTRLRNLMSPVLSVDDLEDWERLLVPAEAAHARRLDEINQNLPHRRSIAATLGKDHPRWTALDLDHAYALAEAHAGGVLRDIVDDPGVEPRWAVGDTSTLDALPKREVVAHAKTEAAALGLAAPKSYADVTSDVVLFAATWAAVKRSPNTNQHTRKGRNNAH